MNGAPNRRRRPRPRARAQQMALVPTKPVREVAIGRIDSSIADLRGYSDDELFALAEVGYHYLRSGGLRLALVIFEGLTAIKPEEAYFWLALGLVCENLGDKRRAWSSYARAGALDPTDARPDLNLAELAIAVSDVRRAAALLRRARDKASNAGDAALERKACALLGTLRTAVH